MAQKLYREEDINNIGKAIQVATGDKQTKYLVSEMAHAIEAIRGVEPKDVNFYDYDGKLLYAYTTEEALHLTELPSLPDHTDIGLINEGWNWRLEDIQSMQDPCVDVGCTYIPSDGLTRIYMDIWKPTTIVLSLAATTANTCFVDWGDSSERTPITKLTTAGYGDWLSHEYTTAGKYVIELIPSDNDKIQIGGDASFITPSTQYQDQNKSMCTKIICGRNIILGSNCFKSLIRIESLLLNTTIDNAGIGVADGYYPDGVYVGMNMPIFILPLDWRMNGDRDYKTLLTNNLVLCSRPYITNRSYETFLATRVNKHVMCNLIGRPASQLYDSLLCRGTVTRYDIYYERTLYVPAPIGSNPSLQDMYYQKSVSIPLFSNSYNSGMAGIKLHVPAIMYDDMMELTVWNTTFTGEIIPYESEWQNNYERLIHIPELISGIRIDKWGNVSEDAGSKATDYIPVTPGETLYFNGTDGRNTFNFYDSEKTHISGDWMYSIDSHFMVDIDGGGASGYWIVPDNAAYIRFSAGNSYGDPLMHWQEAWRKLN